MQAWFPTGEPVHGRGSCPPTSLSTGFSEWGLGHISHAWNGSPYQMKQQIETPEKQFNRMETSDLSDAEPSAA